MKPDRPKTAELIARIERLIAAGKFQTADHLTRELRKLDPRAAERLRRRCAK